jgi:hypothetical protein
MLYLRSNWLPFLVIGAGFALSLALALAPFNVLLRNTIPDDSFYYLQIARNIVHGFGSSFDGQTLANGYHPLWLLMLIPIYHLFSTGVVMDTAPIHAALAVEAFLNGLVGVILLAILKRYTQSSWIQALALLSWFFNPFNLYAMENGLETAVSIFFISLFILVAIRAREIQTHNRLIIVGIVGGLMMLARLDNVFYFLMFLSWLLYEYGWLEGFKRALTAGIPASIVVSPYLVWNYVTFGMFFTSASEATTMVEHQLIVQDHGPSILQKIKAVIYISDYTLRQIATQTGAPSVFFVLVGLSAGMFMQAAESTRRLLRHVPIEWFLFGGFALNFIANASIRWSPREWYFIPLHLFMALWIAWLLEYLRVRQKIRMDVLAVCVLLTASLFYINWSKNLKNGYDTSLTMLQATLWMNENVPEGATLGAWNAGIAGYFSTHRLVNLDGLVNNDAFNAIKARNEWAYIKAARIDYISDFEGRVEYRMGSFLGIPNLADKLEEVQPIDGGPTIYKVK